MSAVDYYEVQGLAMPYIGPLPGGLDLDGQKFADWCNFCFEWYDARPLLWQHDKQERGISTKVVGKVAHYARTPAGVWVTCEVDAQSDLSKLVVDGVKEGRLFFSSGAHQSALYSGPEIVKWAWTELTFTHLPANPFAITWPEVRACKRQAQKASGEIDLSGVDPAEVRQEIIEAVLAAFAAQSAFTERLAALQRSLKSEIDPSKAQHAAWLRRDPGIGDAELARRMGLDLDRFTQAVSAGVIGVVTYSLN